MYISFHVEHPYSRWTLIRLEIIFLKIFPKYTQKPWKSVQWESSCYTRAVERRKDGEKDRAGEANDRYAQFCERT